MGTTKCASEKGDGRKSLRIVPHDVAPCITQMQHLVTFLGLQRMIKMRQYRREHTCNDWKQNFCSLALFNGYQS